MAETVTIVSGETGAVAPGQEDQYGTLVEPTVEVEEAPVEAPAEEAEASEERPAWLQSKFDSPEDLAKAYSALEAKYSSSSETKEGELEATDMVQELQEFSNRFFQNNFQLTEDDYAGLEKMGLPRELVSQFADGQKALIESKNDEVMQQIGGQDEYRKMTTWASENLAEEELVSYNKAIESKDPAVINMTVRGLYARYLQEGNAGVSKAPKLIQGETGQKASTGYQSIHELTEAMGDSRYQHDAAYRKEVEQRLAVSNII